MPRPSFARTSTSRAALQFVASLAAVALTAPAGAQEAATTLAPVTVTGAALREGASTRLPLTARETPQSVSTVERVQIEQQSLLSVDAVLRSVTGIHVSFYDTQRPLYFARGFQITDFQVDGMPTYSNSTNQEFDTALYERIDVVRGANGILTGVGTPSATINLIRKRPQRSFGGYVALTAGTWDFYRAEGDVNVPLTADGSVRSRWVFAPQTRHSFRDRYEEDKKAFLGVVEADLGSSTVASIGYQRQDNDPKGPVWGAIPRFAADGSLVDLPRSSNFSPPWTRWSRESGTLFATLDHPLNDRWALKAAYNHTEGETFSLRTYAYGTTVSNAPFPDRATGRGVTLYGAVSGGTEKQDTLDTYVTGKFDLAGRTHDLTVGVMSLRGTVHTDGYSSLGSFRYDIPNVFTWDGNAPEPSYRRTGAFTEQVTRQDGVYASARWRLAEPLSLLTGVRVTHWRRQSNNFDATGTYTTTTARQNVKREPSPYVGLVYDLTPSLSAYASHTRIFNPQNYKDRNNDPLDPVTGSNSEIGVKGEWLDRSVVANFALFETKQANYGVVDSGVPRASLPDGSTAYVGVSGTRSTGFEADLQARIAVGLQATAGITRTRTTRNAADLTYANVPEWTVKLGTQYRLASLPVEIGGQLQWQSRMTGVNVPSPSGPATITQSGFGLLNLNASWRVTESTSVTLAVLNALDKRYWATLDYSNYGDPRFASVTLRSRF